MASWALLRLGHTQTQGAGLSQSDDKGLGGGSGSSQLTWQGQSECVTNPPLIFQRRKLSLDHLPKAVQ